jgi:metallo-beta-lactamase family protein
MKQANMRITFLGAAQTVTGSKFLLEQDGHRILIDCGLFQGIKELRLQNWAPLAVDPASVQAIVLTHAHIDHSGYIPRMCQNGFKGSVFCTAGTRDLCSILLPDSGHLQEEDAAYANRKGFSKHSPALPLYSEKEARICLQKFKAVAFGQEMNVGPFTVKLIPSGHIVGGASVWVSNGKTSVMFSGDLGTPNDLMIQKPASPLASDYVVMESTYGNRTHPPDDPVEALKPLVEEILESPGMLLVPTFAVGRAQLLIYCFYQLFQRYPRLRVPVFVNSPMASKATELYHLYIENHRITSKAYGEAMGMATFITEVEDSIQLNTRTGPGIIISASGMLTGGRILHHLKAFGPHEQNRILLVGFQAPGTRGSALENGSDLLKIHGQYVPIRAKVHSLGVFSAHADRGQLLDWISSIPTPPQTVFLVHGNPEAQQELASEIHNKLNFRVHIPRHGESRQL